MLKQIGVLPDALGKPETVVADTGYLSAANVTACTAAGIDPLIAVGRRAHHPPLGERLTATGGRISPEDNTASGPLPFARR